MVDEIDRGIVHALQVHGRAPFARIGAVLGVSVQTVARRYRTLRAEAGLRVVGLVDPGHSGTARWLVRLTAAPRSAGQVAAALARRPDTSWVKLVSGGTEIAVIVDDPVGDADHALLLQHVPRTAAVSSVSAHYLLHLYRGGPTPWLGRVTALDADQQAALAPHTGGASGHAQLTPADEPLLAAMRVDARATLAELAGATGWAAATVRRRLDELEASGALFYDVEFPAALLGAATGALLWMAVAPARLDAVATALAEHPELAFVAATTGPTNLAAHVLVPDPAALHRYLTQRLGAIEEIRTIESAPVLRTVKAVGPSRGFGP